MSTQIKLRRGTAVEWSAANPILALGEPGYDTTNKIMKIGDGTTPWNSLSSIAGNVGSQGIQGTQGIQGRQGTQGIQGRQGTQGTQGTQGIQGTQGTQGQAIQGTQGTIGPSGGVTNSTTVPGVTSVELSTLTVGTDGSLEYPNTNYHVRVYAYDSSGNHSAVKIDYHVYVDTSSYGHDQVLLSWGAIPNASYYRVYFMSDSYNYVSYGVYSYNDTWRYFQTTSTSYTLSTNSGATLGDPPDTAPVGVNYDFTNIPDPWKSTSGLKVEGDIKTNGSIYANGEIRLVSNSSMSKDASLKLDFKEQWNGLTNYTQLLMNESPGNTSNGQPILITIKDNGISTSYTPLMVPAGIHLGESYASFGYNGVILNASSLGAAYTFQFPTSAGSNHQLLYSNGALTGWAYAHGKDTQYYTKSTTTAIANNKTTLQTIFGNSGDTSTNGFYLSSGNHEIEMEFNFYSDGTVSHVEEFALANTSATNFSMTLAAGTFVTVERKNISTSSSAYSAVKVTTLGVTQVSTTITSATNNVLYRVRGVIAVDTAGRINPCIKFTNNAPGGVNAAGTGIAPGAWIRITPIYNSTAPG